MERYSVIHEKNRREIVLLRGRGCRWRKCSFCDYHLDACADENSNFLLNRAVLEKVSGVYGTLEVINSGSFPELDERTMDCIERVCAEKSIRQIHFECHWMYREKIKALRCRFASVPVLSCGRNRGVAVKIKTGVETFDIPFRETYLQKGFGSALPCDIAQYADEVCLLFGLSGQTARSMIRDIETGLRYFERVCVNIMTENSTSVKPDAAAIDIFRRDVYPRYAADERIDILFDNTDFGVGEN